MSNRITITDEQHASIKKIQKQQGYEEFADAASAVVSAGITRKFALKTYADKKAAEKPAKEKKPKKDKKSKGEKKKKKASKSEAAPEKKAKKKKKAAKEAVDQSSEEVSID